MKAFIRHIVEQPFVVATGTAALIHSTWTLATMMEGLEPNPQFSFAWFAWLIPALLIAFSLDIGQIVTSFEIRAGHRTRGKFITFGVFAVSTYYLQWVYVASHMPAIVLAAGVHSPVAAQIMIDLGVWIIPLLLPLSTLLYTLSQSKVERIEERITQQANTVEPNLNLPALPAETRLIPASFTVKCERCEREFTKENQFSANAALRAHTRRCNESVKVR